LKNVAHSISERLGALAKAGGEDYLLILARYGVERLLYRMSQHPEASHFVLKGASLFLVWVGHSFRTTRDVDLLGYGESDLGTIGDLFRSICCMETSEQDGLRFDADSMQASRIKEDQAYQGVRLTFFVYLGKMRIPMQVDIGFGDAITPAPVWVDFPCLLDAPVPRIMAYPIETAIAEKFLAIAEHGMENSRMKDYYDLHVIAKSWTIDPEVLCRAILNSCKARKLIVPVTVPVGLTDSFALDTRKNMQWLAFTRKGGLTFADLTLGEVIEVVVDFMRPTIDLLRKSRL